ncbi:MAG: hypothetical protein E7568_05560 [Ruminococcaceae bacterium]|nr:hypothetical protein [Oscillospiraceae bacterium]
MEMVTAIMLYIMAHVVAITSLLLLIDKDNKYKREVEKNKELYLENKKLCVLNLYLKKKLNFKSIQESEQNVR